MVDRGTIIHSMVEAQCIAMLFNKVKDEDQALGMAFLDGTTTHAHHKGAIEDAAEIVRRLAGHLEALTPKSV